MRVLRCPLAALLPIVALTATLGAQSAGTGGIVVRRADPGPTQGSTHREIPAEAARALIAAHHADIVDGSLDPAIVTLVLDNDNNYMASSVSKPAVVQRSPNGSVAAAGGFVVATPVMVSSATGGTGGAGAKSGVDGNAPHATMTIAGIGPIDGAAVQEMFWTNYAAGEIGPVAVRVRFVILKAAK